MLYIPLNFIFLFLEKIEPFKLHVYETEFPTKIDFFTVSHLKIDMKRYIHTVYRVVLPRIIFNQNSPCLKFAL